MTRSKGRFEWPTRVPFYDDAGRLVAEHHVSQGNIIARVTFDPSTKLKTSYSTGGVTLFYQSGVLVRKEVKNDDGNVASVECYSPRTGTLHSQTSEPAHTKYSPDGKVVYMAWYTEGKKDRPAKLNKRTDTLVPQPAIVKDLPDGITEHAYYRNDELNDPIRNFAAIQYLKGNTPVLECHFHNNQLHNSEGPAVLSTHEKTKLIAQALNGRVVSAEFAEPHHTCSYKFNEQGEVIAEDEVFDLSHLPKDDPAFSDEIVSGFVEGLAATQRSEFSNAMADPNAPQNRRHPSQQNDNEVGY